MEIKGLKKINIFLYLSLSILPLLLVYITIIYRPAGYVINIYENYPIFYWILLFVFYLLILFFGIINREKKYLYIFLLVIFFLLIFIIPSGYVLSDRTDDLSHLGEIIHIEKIGSISDNNIYPLSHILFSNLKLIAGLDSIQLKNIIYISLSLLFILFNFCLVSFYLKRYKESAISKNIIILLMTFFFIYLLGEYQFTIKPHLFAFILFPLSLYLFISYLENKDKKKFLIFTVFAIVMPIAHPLFGLTFAGSIFIIIFVKFILINKNIYRFKSALRLFILSIIPTLIWFFYYKPIFEMMSSSLRKIVLGSAPSVSLRTTTLLNIGNFKFYELLYNGVVLYLGRYFFLGIILIIFLLTRYIIWKKSKKNFFSIKIIKELFLILLFFTILQLFFIFAPLTNHNPERFVNINIVVIILLPLIIISSLKLCFEYKKFLSLLLIILILCQITSIMIVFPSPMIFLSNNSLSSNEIIGMTWLDNNKNSLRIGEFQGQLVDRYYDFKSGFNSSEEKLMLIQTNVFINKISNGSGLDRLFYDKYNHFPINNFYIVLTSSDTEPYLKIDKWQKTGRLFQSDIKKLNNDLVVNKVYCSLNIVIYKT